VGKFLDDVTEKVTDTQVIITMGDLITKSKVCYNEGNSP